MPQQNRYSNDRETTSITAENVIKEVQKLKSMSDLEVEKFAEMDGWANNFIQDLKNKRHELKATQLRKFFHQVKDLKKKIESSETFDRTEVSLMIPTLAYASGRNLIPRDFFTLMSLCFGKEKCKSKADFLRAVDFLEAIMAYHKYHNPKS